MELSCIFQRRLPDRRLLWGMSFKRVPIFDLRAWGMIRSRPQSVSVPVEAVTGFY